MLEFFDAATTGGIFGAIAGLGKQIIGFFERKQLRAHELEVRQMDLRQTQLEGEQAQKLAQIQKSTALELQSGEVVLASHLQDAAKYYDGNSRLLEWVDFFRGMNRIVLTWYLSIACMVIYFTTGDAHMQSLVINAVVFLAATAVGWWFGERPLKKLQL